MKNFQIIRYLKKILPIIVIICVLATYAINFKLKNSNTFVASEVIHYNDPAAEQGLTPTGSKLDVNEMLVLVCLAGLFYGIGNGIIYKMGYTTGGGDVVMQLVSKYLKVFYI